MLDDDLEPDQRVYIATGGEVEPQFPARVLGIHSCGRVCGECGLPVYALESDSGLVFDACRTLIRVRH